MRERLAWLSSCFAKSEGQLLRVAGPRGQAGSLVGVLLPCGFSRLAQPPAPPDHGNGLSRRTCPGYLCSQLPSHYWGRIRTKVGLFFSQVLCANTQKNAISVSVTVPEFGPALAGLRVRICNGPEDVGACRLSSPASRKSCPGRPSR